MTHTPLSPDEAERDTLTRGDSRWWIVLAVASGFVLMALRRPDSAVGLYMWAEDGTVFIQNAYGGDLGLVFQPYAGQWWPLMRLAAAPLVLLPAQWWPLAAYLMACLLGSLAMGVVLQKRATGVLGPLPLRIALYVVLVLQPIVWEAHGNITNTHIWVAIGLLVILVLPAPLTRWGKGLESGFIVIGCLTGLLGVLLLPAAIWGLVRNRGAYQWLRLALVGGSAVVNVGLQWSVRQPGSASWQDYVGSTAVFVVKRFAGGLLLGERGQLDHWNGDLLSWLIIPSILVLVGLAFLVLRDLKGPSPIWIFSGFLWLGLGLTAIVSRSLEEIIEPFSSGRYLNFAVGATILIIFRAFALPARSGRLVAAALLLAMSFNLVAGFLMATEPAVPYSTIDRAQLEAFGTCVRQGPYPCVLPIAPEGWSLVIEAPR